MNYFSDKVSFIWAWQSRSKKPYDPHQHGRTILPWTVVRRLDCVLEAAKQKVKNFEDFI
jgi:type I restriction enzyme M protein